MSPREILQECDREVCALLPEVRRSVQKGLAAVLCGVVRARSVVLSRAGLSMPGAATAPSQARRAQRLLANARLDVGRVQRRLLRRALGGRRGRVDLLLDAVVRGASARRAGTVTLVLALAWRRRALPLVWQTWPVDAPGQAWQAAIRRMLATVAAELPPGVQVVVLADRGLSGCELARAVLGQGWHFLWRVRRTPHARLADGAVMALGELAPAPGSCRLLTGVRLYAPRRKARPGAGGWAHEWERAVRANVVALWRAHDPEPWLLATDLPAARARCAEYRRRTWEEELFRDLKRLGWQWQDSRVRAPERVQRLLAVLALATLWMLALGQRLVHRGGRRQVDSRRTRTYSYFQLGLRWAQRQWDAGGWVPCRLALWPQPRAPLKLS